MDQNTLGPQKKQIKIKINKMELLDKLNWRYAAKAMNGEKVAQEKIDNIIEAISLAPTSSGLQPFEVIVIKNQEIKEKIKPIAWNQSVITDCSHLFVFAAWDTYTADRINKMFDLTNTIRGFKNEGWENYRQMLLKSYPQKDAQENFNHAAKQAYIAFSQAIAAAAFEGVDSTPLEGFDADALDKILGLREKGLRSCVMLPIGYRDENNDWLVSLKKVRKSKEDLVTVIE
ncbi:MAG: nitroreductase/dihydropteridine reductase [Cyclobacteriaceae bacterium]|jgi:nitroreductase/dihydropteridine reductase